MAVHVPTRLTVFDSLLRASASKYYFMSGFFSMITHNCCMYMSTGQSMNPKDKDASNMQRPMQFWQRCTCNRRGVL